MNTLKLILGIMTCLWVAVYLYNIEIRGITLSIRNFMSRVAIVLFLWGISIAISRSISIDILFVKEKYDFETDPDKFTDSNSYIILIELCFIGLFSIYRLWQYIYNFKQSNNYSSSINKSDFVKKKLDITLILSHPIVNIISLISSILGILSFYKDFFLKK